MAAGLYHCMNPDPMVVRDPGEKDIDDVTGIWNA